MQESEEIVRAAACDVKLGLHTPTLLYNICWSDSVGALSTHVFRTNMGAKRSSIVGSTNVV